MELIPHLLDVPTEDMRHYSVTDARRPPPSNQYGILVTICARASTRTRASVAAAAQIMGMGHAELPWDSFYGNPRVHPAAPENMSAEIRSLAAIGARAVIARVSDQRLLVDMSEGSPIPIVSGATASWHPLQGLADLRVILRAWPHRSDVRLAFVGNGQGPVISSLLTILTHSGIHVIVVTPEGYEPRPDVLVRADPCHYDCTTNLAGLRAVDVIYTDEWFYRRLTPDEEETFTPYRITEDLVRRFAPHACVMHCLPFATEIERSLLYGPRSFVWQQARERTESLVRVLEHLLTYASTSDWTECGFP